ncbi:CBS domain-containing protein [Thiohalorhabdus sp.]|uniref:CBS domain-containing protein n=1 Tax=Thiohalorhabdus sp. TaxID=3094134 RepID=UPI002FC28A59
MANRQHPETVVTSHPNADLDALGSMVAARHLYPGAVAVLSQGAEPQALTLLRWLGETAPAIFDASQVALDGVATLVIVDTSDPRRLGPFAELAGFSGIRLVVHDHHGGDLDQLPPHAEVQASRGGANTSGMVAELRSQGAPVGPEEATVMAAGIYEDTGMLTYAGVTGSDFDAARWLLDREADLTLVGQLLRQELSPEQVGLFHQLLEGARRVPGLRHEVLLASVEDPNQVQDAAGVVQRVMDSVEADAFLGLIQQGNRVFGIGRARPDGPDMGGVLGELGGGGHPYAASASLPGVPLAETRQRAEAALRLQDGQVRTVGELGSRPVHTLPADLTLDQAAQRLRRYPLARMPVVADDGRPLGWVEQGLLGRAHAHGLGDQALSDYVAPLPTLAPDASLHEAEAWILDRDYPLVGVVEEGRLTAVVTRSDLVRNWREESGEVPEPQQRSGGGKRNLEGRLRQLLDPDTVGALRELGGLAAEQGVRAFLVGGLVRDLILNRPNTDVDIAVEGDAIALAEAFAEWQGWHAHSHPRFGTAVLKGPRGERFDLATSRIEHYPYPAALPEVEAGSIKADLFRRDFAINALAMELDGPRFGRLLDPFGGLRDIRQGIIRVLHSLSFVEDPTRIVRAARFEAELGFEIDGASQRLIRNAVDLDMPARLSGHRLFRELRYLLDCPAPGLGVARLGQLGMLLFIHGVLAGDEGKVAIDRVKRGEEVLDWYRLLYRPKAPSQWKVLTLLLLWGLDSRRLESALSDYEVRSREAAALARDRAWAADFTAAMSRRELIPDEDVPLFEWLEQLSLDGLLACMAASEDQKVKAGISHYLQHLRGIRPALDGSQLQALGVPQGPAVGEWLQALTRARVRGEVHDSDDEKALVRAGEIPA